MRQLEPSVNSTIPRLCGIETPPGAVVLASSQSVSQAIERLAGEIQPWIDAEPEKPAVIVALLEGGRFYADRLISALRDLCTCGFSRLDLKVTTRDGNGGVLASPSIMGDVASLDGRRVLVVDDILDSGVTLNLTQDRLRGHAAEIKSTVLIQKDPPAGSNGHSELRPIADYVGLRFIDSRWYSGCGMDMPGDAAGVVRNAELIIAYPPVIPG